MQITGIKYKYQNIQMYNKLIKYYIYSVLCMKKLLLF